MVKKSGREGKRVEESGEELPVRYRKKTRKGFSGKPKGDGLSIRAERGDGRGQ